MQPRTRSYAFFHWLNLFFLVLVAYATFHTGRGEVAGGGLVLEMLRDRLAAALPGLVAGLVLGALAARRWEVRRR